MQEGDQQHASLTALFTFVARDPVTKRSMPINPIQPQTPDEVALFQERQAVADARKAARQGQLPAHRSGTCLHTYIARLPSFVLANMPLHKLGSCRTVPHSSGGSSLALLQQCA